MKTFIKLFALWAVLAAMFLACDKDITTTPGTPTTPTTPVGTTKSSAKAITKFSFAALSPAVEGAISGTAITAAAPATADLTKLVPTITVSDKASVSPASGVVQDFSKEVTYTVTAEDGTKQEYKVNVSKAAAVKSSAKNILTVAFSGTSPVVNASVDTTAKTATALLPAGTDVTRLTPTITVSEKATINPASGVVQNFTNPVTYTVTAEDGSTKTFTVKAATDAYYYSNIRLTVNEDNGQRSVNDSSLLSLRTGKVYSLKDGAANAANIDMVLNNYCALELYSPAAIIYCGVGCGVGRVNEIMVGQKWAVYRKSFIDAIVRENVVKVGEYQYGQIPSTEWGKVSFAADIAKQFTIGRALTMEKANEYLDGKTHLTEIDNNCTPTNIYDKPLYRFLTQEGKRGLIKVNKFGKTAKGGYYIVIDIKIEK